MRSPDDWTEEEHALWEAEIADAEAEYAEFLLFLIQTEQRPLPPNEINFDQPFNPEAQ